MSVLANENIVTLWKEAIRSAEERCLISLEQRIETYLISLLNRYTNQPELVKQIFAITFLEGVKHQPQQRLTSLQVVGDQCLLFAGLFPQQANKRLVTIKYFVDLGRTSYATISAQTNDLFASLATQFVILMDVLQAINSQSTLLPLEAYEQWELVGSQRALKTLKSYTSGFPMKNLK